jgi:hypothetical protein
MRRSLNVLLLLCLLFTMLPIAAASAAAPTPTWRVVGSGRLGNGASFSATVDAGAAGTPRGTIVYAAPGQPRIAATILDSLTTGQGTATVTGKTRRGRDLLAFKMTFVERSNLSPALLRFELTGTPTADTFVKTGSIKITVPPAAAVTAPPSTTAAPTTPVANATSTAAPPTNTPTIAPPTTTPTSAPPTTTPTEVPPNSTPLPSPSPTPAPSVEQRAEPTTVTRMTAAAGSVTLEVPPGAIAEPATFSHTDRGGRFSTDSQRMLRSFKLEAKANDGRQIRQFATPLHLVVKYTDADLTTLRVDARKLHLYYQDDVTGAWVQVPSVVDPVARTLTAALDHFTVFAIGTGEGFETAGAAATVFTDNFANLQAWTTAQGTGAVAANILTANGTNGADDRFMLTSAAYGDLTYEAGISDQSLNANHRMGLIFRHSSAAGGSYYFAYLNNGQVGLGKVVNGGALTNVGPAPVNIGYAANTFVWVRVQVTGADIVLSTANAAGGPWTQRIATTDAGPLAAGAVGVYNDNTAGVTRVSRFRDPLIRQTMPLDWTGITQTTGRPGVAWDRLASSAHGGSGSIQLFAANAANVGYVAQTTNNANTCGTVCSVGGWIKTTGVSSAAGDGAKIVLVQLPSNTQTTIATQTGTAGWTQYTGSVTLAGGTTSIQTRLVLDGSGVASFDDVVVNAPIVADGGFEAAGPTGAPYFDDNLADPTAFQFSAGNGSVAGGVLTTSGTAGNPGFDAFTATNSDDLTDFTWVAAVRPSADSANLYAGLQFRFQNVNNYYAWLINPGTNTVLLVENSGGNLNTLQSNGYATVANTWYWLRVVTAGNQITGSIAPATGAGGGPGAWTQFATHTDASPVVYGRVGMGNAVYGGAPIPASFKGPSLKGTYPSGWSAGGIQQVAGRPGAMWDGRAGTAHAGTRSLQLFGADVTAIGYLSKSTLAVAGTTTHQVEGWIKTSALTSAANGASIVVIESPSGVQTTLGGVTGTTAWTRYTGSFTTQANTTAVDVRVYLKGAGTANFDDIAVTATGASPTPPPPPPPPPPAGSQQSLYGAAQTVSYGAPANLARSIVQPQAFDGNAATTTGTIGSATTNRWTWTQIEDTNFATITDAFVQARFYQTGWVDDTFVLEYSTNNWTNSTVLATFNAANPPPSTISTYTSASLKAAITTPALANALQLRFRGVSVAGGADNIGLNVDAVRLTVFGQPPAYDAFDRADSATKLGSGSPAGHQYSGQADTGQPWQTDSSVWGISGNAAYAVGPAGSGNYVRLIANTLPQDQTVTVTVPTSYDGQVGLLSRVGGDWSEMVWVGLDAAGVVEVWTLTLAAGWNLVATGNATLSFPLTLSASAVGTNLTVSVNGVPVALPAFAVQNNAGAVGAGMYVDTTGATWAKIDSFEVR